MAIFDLDGTITRKDTFAAFLLYVLARHPRRWWKIPQLISVASMFWLGRKSNSWLKETCLILIAGGMSRRQIDDLARRHCQRVMSRFLRAESMTVIRSHSENDQYKVLLTASPDIYVNTLASHLKMDLVICTRTQFGSKDNFTGHLVGKNCYGEEKVRRLLAELPLGGASGKLNAVAYTDHHSDLPLLEICAVPVAVCPSRKLQQLALDRGYSIQDWG